MKKYELLNQLQNEMKEARVTVEQLCTEWNWTLSDKEVTAVTNKIVISKGQIVEVPIVKEVVKYETKEVVVDNTDTATIEMLRETIRQMNQTTNDMNKQHDEEIKELQEELNFKELLLNEFRDNMDKKISRIHELENKIAEPKEKEVVIASDNKEIDRLYEENARHIRRINELAAHNEQLVEDGKKLETEVCNLQGQILGYKDTIAKLEKRIKELEGLKSTSTNNTHDKVLNQTPVVKVETTKEESQEKYTWITVEIPNDLKDNAELLALINEGEQSINKAQREVSKKALIKGFNDKIAKMIKELKTTNEYNVSVNYERSNKDEVVAAYGEITIEDKTYCYKYHRCFANPTVYGLMNKEQLDKAFSEIKRLCKIDSLTSSEFVIREEDVVYDIANDIVYWKTDDEAYKGYTSKYSFVWNPAKYAVPTAALNHNALKDETFRAMRNFNPATGKKAWSLDAEREGIRVMNYLRQVIAETPEEIVVPVTKEETTKTTKENVSVVTNDDVKTKEEYVVDGVSFCDDDIDIF
jgi:hypothetical protein